MADLDLNELISVERREAFAAMWPAEKEAAAVEVRRLLEWVTKPAQHLNDTQKLVRRMLSGLVGEFPDVDAWLQAVAVGSLQLRNDQRYVIMRANEKPARFIERGLKTYDEGVSGRQRWAGKTDEGVRDGMHLVAFLILAKELKNLASGPTALGPAWPLMVAIDKYLTNEEKRALHAAGANKELQRALADAVKAAVAETVSGRNPNKYPGGRAADWRRELPPGADVNAHFEEKKARAAAIKAKAPQNDIRIVEKMILSGPRPSFIPRDPEKEEAALPMRLKMLLPIGEVANDTFAKAIRAIARHKAREEAVRSGAAVIQSDDFKIQVWLRAWVRRGGGIPADLPVIYFGYLEEEACLAFEMKGWDWVGADKWRAHRIIGGEPSGAKPEELPWDFWDDQPTTTWIEPQRDVVPVNLSDPEYGIRKQVESCQDIRFD